MKIRIAILGLATIALCSSAVAYAGAVRPAKARPIAKSALKVSRASAKLRDENKDGKTIPIVLLAAAAGGGAIYLATKSDNTASR
jgi:hypothetical protein